MKLEIDLDLNQIDYEAINKQIQDKIDTMNLSETYQINSKIDCFVKEDVGREVHRYFDDGCWSGLNNSSRKEIHDEISKNIRELIKPHVENIFNQIPPEEFDKIISELIPRILIDLITTQIEHTLTNYYAHAQNMTMQMCENRINEILRR